MAEFMIVNRRTGKALQVTGAENGQSVVQAAPTGEDAQLWTQSGTRGPVKLVNKLSGRALDVVQGGVENGTWAHVWDDVDTASQQWEIVKLTATYKKLRNVQSGRMLDIVNMSEEDGALAQIWDDVDGTGQQWKFVAADAPSKTVTRTAKKQEEAAPASRKTRTRKVAEAVKEAAQVVKKTARKPATEKKK